MTEKEIILEELVIQRAKAEDMERERRMMAEKGDATSEQEGELSEGDDSPPPSVMQISADSPYFNPTMDIELLTDVLTNNPWRSVTGWQELGHIVRKGSSDVFSNFHMKTQSLKERVEFLLSGYRKNTLSLFNKAGTEEQYEQRKELLRYVSEMERMYNLRLKRSLESNDTQSNADRKAVKLNNDCSTAEKQSTVEKLNTAGQPSTVDQSQASEQPVMTEQPSTSNDSIPGVAGGDITWEYDTMDLECEAEGGENLEESKESIEKGSNETCESTLLSGGNGPVPLSLNECNASDDNGNTKLPHKSVVHSLLRNKIIHMTRSAAKNSKIQHSEIPGPFVKSEVVSPSNAVMSSHRRASLNTCADNSLTHSNGIISNATVPSTTSANINSINANGITCTNNVIPSVVTASHGLISNGKATPSTTTTFATNDSLINKTNDLPRIIGPFSANNNHLISVNGVLTRLIQPSPLCVGNNGLVKVIPPVSMNSLNTVNPTVNRIVPTIPSIVPSSWHDAPSLPSGAIRVFMPNETDNNSSTTVPAATSNNNPSTTETSTVPCPSKSIKSDKRENEGEEQRLKAEELEIRKMELKLRREELEQRIREFEQQKESARLSMEARRDERQVFTEMVSQLKDDMCQLVKQQMTLMTAVLEVVNKNT